MRVALPRNRLLLLAFKGTQGYQGVPQWVLCAGGGNM
jgi:hypothetical protein